MKEAPTNNAAVDVLRAKLKDHVQRKGLKSSARRDLILDTMLRIGRHITAEDLHQAVRSRDPRVGLATVYRTLRLLQDSGIVAERQFKGGTTMFELLDETHHDHLICTQCDSIIEFEDSSIEEHQRRVAELHGFELISHRHELYGICARCRKKTSKS